MAMTYPDPKAAEEDRRLQADPEVDMSGGRANTWQMLFTAIAAIAIVVVTFFGLTHHRADKEQTASTPTSETTGAAAPATQQEGKSQGAGQAAQGKQKQSQGGQAAQQQGGPGGNQSQANQQGQQPDPSQQPNPGQKPSGGPGAPQTTGAAASDSSAPAPTPPSGKASQGGQQKK